MSSRSESAHMVELDRQYAEQRGQEASQAAWEAEEALLRQCPLCKPSGGHYARLARHDDHVRDLPAGWTAP